jgi:hypothetical protein
MKKEEERKMVFAKHKWCLFEVDREDNHFFFFAENTRDMETCVILREEE